MKRIGLNIAALIIVLLLVVERAFAAPTQINTWSASVTASTGLPVNTSTSTQMQTGDLLIAFLTTFGTAAISSPAGWTTRVAQWGTVSGKVFTKVAAAADIGATFTFTNGGVSDFWSGGIVAFRNAQYDTAGSGSSGASTVPTAAAITVAQPNTVLCFFQSTGNSSNVTAAPSGFASAYTIQTTGSIEGSEVDTKASVAAGSTGTVASGGTGWTGPWIAVLVSVNPAPSHWWMD